MGFFGLFTSPPDISIHLEGEGKGSSLSKVKRRVEKNNNSNSSIIGIEECPVFSENARISGNVIIRLRPGTNSLDHEGIYIEFLGCIERINREYLKSDSFLSHKVQLVPGGGGPLKDEVALLPFDFSTIDLPFESYDGIAITLKYVLRAIITRKNGDYRKEMTVLCKHANKNETDHLTLPGIPIELDVGLEEFLHIQLLLEKSNFSFIERITGVLKFHLVRVKIIDAEVNLVRKEILSNEEVLSQTVLAKKQILDGPAYRGDQFPVDLDLITVYDLLTPSMKSVHKTFSVTYFIGIVLRDSEGRKYYKQTEIFLQPPPSSSLDDIPKFANFKFGLVEIK